MAVFLFVFAAIFGVYAIGRSWLGPVHLHVEISQNPRVLPLYALYSLVRISVAYALSLIFALSYAYVAASSRRAEIIMVPLLDILQSIPVLSFLPGVMLAMVAIFPHSQLGVELGSILLIFTGQVWNIAFSFYSSLKTVPRELHEVAIIYPFSRWQRFAELDLPFSTIGLVWNRSEEHTSELQSHSDLVCRLLLEKKKSSSSMGLRAASHSTWRATTCVRTASRRRHEAA